VQVMKTSIVSILFIFPFLVQGYCNDLHIIGKVTDNQQSGIPGAEVSFLINSVSFLAKTDASGSYSLTIPDHLAVNLPQIELGTPFPNPFYNSVSFPFITRIPGDIQFAVYNLAGRKVFDRLFKDISSGSYRLTWNGQFQSPGLRPDERLVTI